MSDSQPQQKIRALSLRSLCVLVVLCLGALEIGVRRTYDPPTPMRYKARVFQAKQHTTDQLLIFGTCLPEQIISPELLQSQIGQTVEVKNLATAAGTSRLMYLTLKNYIPEEAPVRGIVVLMAPLISPNAWTPMNPRPWKSRTLAMYQSW